MRRLGRRTSAAFTNRLLTITLPKTAAVFHALRDRLTPEESAQLASTREGRWMTLAVFAALKQQLSPGEAEDVQAQLPKDLKEVWVEAGGV